MIGLRELFDLMDLSDHTLIETVMLVFKLGTRQTLTLIHDITHLIECSVDEVSH